jgi:hypothetical protein
MAGGSTAENIAHMRKLGYFVGKHVNLYGEHMELVSDPFEDGECVAVNAVSASNPTVRKIDLPLSLLAGLEDLLPEPADPAASEPGGTGAGKGHSASDQSPEQGEKEKPQ